MADRLKRATALPAQASDEVRRTVAEILADMVAFAQAQVRAFAGPL